MHENVFYEHIILESKLDNYYKAWTSITNSI